MTTPEPQREAQSYRDYWREQVRRIHLTDEAKALMQDEKHAQRELARRGKDKEIER